MNISCIVGKKFEWKNSSNHRMLSGIPNEGIISCGYARKNKNHGSHYSFVTKEYHGLLVLSGSGVYKDQDHEIEVSTGDFIQRIPGTPHSTIITSDNWSELFVVIGSTLYNTLVSINVLSNSSPVLHPGLDYEMVQSLLHIHDQLSFVDRLELPLLVPQMISYLTRVNYLDKVSQPTSNEKDILAMAVTYIHENIESRLNVEEIAQHVNIGYEKFRKLFTTHYNLSPGNYIIHTRIHQAQKLLTNTDLSVKEVSIRLGYMDSYTFSKQFKKITGRSPSDFKQFFVQ